MHKLLPKGLLGLYVLVLVPLNLLGHILHIPILELISKPLLLPVLLAFFVASTKGKSAPWKLTVVLALAFSWVGDVSLMFDTEYPFMFIVGLLGFLIAHLNYSYSFIKSGNKITKLSKSNWIVLPILILYTVGLISVLWPHLGDLRIPVFVYALVLLSMGVTALIRNEKIGYYWVLVGAILFIISDSILAINKFYQPFESARYLTMLTYTMAQLFIVFGLSKLLRSRV